jgi:hypothetical protein
MRRRNTDEAVLLVAKDPEVDLGPPHKTPHSFFDHFPIAKFAQNADM